MLFTVQLHYFCFKSAGFLLLVYVSAFLFGIYFVRRVYANCLSLTLHEWQANEEICRWKRPYCVQGNCYLLLFKKEACKSVDLNEWNEWRKSSCSVAAQAVAKHWLITLHFSFSKVKLHECTANLQQHTMYAVCVQLAHLKFSKGVHHLANQLAFQFIGNSPWICYALEMPWDAP